VYFEQGLIGVSLFVLLCLSACVALLSRMQRADQSAPMFLASLMAVLSVGLFDSLLDFTRINVLIFLLLWLSLMRTQVGGPGPARSAR
jgi:O-antigen ligase